MWTKALFMVPGKTRPALDELNRVLLRAGRRGSRLRLRRVRRLLQQRAASRLELRQRPCTALCMVRHDPWYATFWVIAAGFMNITRKRKSD